MLGNRGMSCLNEQYWLRVKMEGDRRSQSQAGTSHPLHLEDCTVGLGIQGRKLRSRVKGMKSYKGEDPLPLRSSHSLQYLVKIMTCGT
jgi:hypothetical protein